MKLTRTLFAILLTTILTNLSAQYDSKKFTYNETDKNYINYEALEDLTHKMLLKDKAFFNESEVAKFIYSDRSTLPQYTDEQIHKKILAIPAMIPMKYDPIVGQLVRYFLFERREYMTRMLTQSQVYFPIFEEVLEDKDLPIELKYLSIVESALNPMARSRVGATGLWQFMHGTAKYEGMEINTLVDERGDVHKSTEFAANFLKKLYNIYGDWPLALAAYNSGPGNVNKAIKRSGGHDFWSIKSHLPKETQNYVPTFIAICYAMHYAKEYQLFAGKPLLNFQTAKTEILFEKNSLKYISELAGTTEETLKQYNPALKKGIVPQTSMGYKLLIPKEFAANFESKKHLLNLDPYIYNPAYTQPGMDESILASSTSNSVDVGSAPSIEISKSYTKSDIESNQSSAATTVQKIASTPVAVKTEVQAITTAEVKESIINQAIESKEYTSNETEKREVRKDPRSFAKSPAGSVAHTPTEIAYTKPSSPASNSDYKVVKVVEYKNAIVNYTVRSGDNLTEIADKYNVSIKDIRKWNNMDANDNLHAGKRLKIQHNEKVIKPQYVLNQSQAKNTTNDDDKVVIHKIAKGENIYQIAKKYGCSVEEIKDWNGLSDDNVKIGDELFVYHETQSEPTKISSYSYYVANLGDTLLSASNKFNVSIELLKSLNNKDADEPLKKGEKIKIPAL